ncbi:MAG: 16S rRNA (adenine(1518)-N(6)/adenine(1519)-N(6))-dimethyltransferase RsmA [Candidatus Pacebacteria bacterium]|nr:16S rRNA (adenine(1518)-N(6)/adenine(1519)-N(6))-dimethyltransferase RsmA [Candidatus Paceibacterota bacterium]
MRAKKSLGQHFLVAPQSIIKTVEAAGVSPTDTILEIGPGEGALTKELVKRSGKVIAVEKDLELARRLEETFTEEVTSGKLVIVPGDILEINLASLGLHDHAFIVVANIPYYITGLILRSLLENTVQPKSIVFIVQKEIAERIAREKKESILSLSVKAYGTPRYVGTIKAGAFRPVPRVDSAILAIENISRDFFGNSTERRFFEIVKAGFASKRKYLLNNLQTLTEKEALINIFKKIDLDENVRAEDVPLEMWRELTEEIS